MDVRILEYMIAIEEEGSLVLAADKVHISQSALSQSLSKLEQELGVSLFTRIEKRWIPTGPGKRYLKGAREMLRIKNETYQKIHRLAGLKRNVIRVAICSQVSLLYRDSILSALRERFPDIRLELHQTDANLARKYLSNDIVDAAIFGATAENNSLIEFHPLYTEQLVLAVSAGPAYDGTDPDLNQIQRLPFILPAEKTFLHTLTKEMLSAKKIMVNDLYKAEDVKGMQTLVTHGYGSAFLPSRVAAVTPSCRVFEWENAPTYTVAYAISRYGSKKEQLLKMFDAIKECMRT